MNTGNETRLPKAGEVWLDDGGEELTIIYDHAEGCGNIGYMWRNPLDGRMRCSWTERDIFTKCFTPKPDPIPGPDEVWVTVWTSPSGEVVLDAYVFPEEAASMAQNVDGPDDPIVRYRKVDPQ